MKIIEIEPGNKYRQRQYIQVPFRLYEKSPYWVPPLETETRQLFDTRKNPFFKHSTAVFFLCLAADGSPVGRLALLDNRNYNDYNHSKVAFFYQFECIHSPEAAWMLFDAGTTWCRQQGLTSMFGPKGFSALDGMGMLVNGFEHIPAFGQPYNHLYYPELIEAVGFCKDSDIVSGYLSAEIEFPPRMLRLAELVRQRRGLQITQFRSKRDLVRKLPEIRERYNEMLQGTSGNVPLTDDEVKAISDQLLWFADPKLIKLVEKDGKLVGFLFAYPDISAAMQKTGGKILPLGWMHYLLEIKRTKWVNINGAGLIEEYQGSGGTALLFSEMYRSILEGQFKHAELVQIGVENDKMQRELKSLGVEFYKTHRMYCKELGDR